MSAPAHPVGARSGRADDPRARGTLTLSDGVLEKIASQVVDDVSDTFGTSRGLLGWRERVGGHARPSVDVDLYRGFADLRIRVGLVYPVSLRSAADAIRVQVQRRVTELTGVEVRRVDVLIDGLGAAPAGARTGNEVLR